MDFENNPKVTALVTKLRKRLNAEDLSSFDYSDEILQLEISNALDMKCTLLIEDKSPDVPNPMKKTVTVVLNVEEEGDDNENEFAIFGKNGIAIFEITKPFYYVTIMLTNCNKMSFN